MEEQKSTPPPQIKCPKCGSNQFYAGKKGFSGKKAVTGAVLTGGIGLHAGTIGSNKIKITCLNCGTVYSPEQTSENSIVTGTQTPKIAPKSNFKAARVLSYIVAGICWFAAFGLLIGLTASDKETRSGMLTNKILFPSLLNF
jgi:tellurium resistance protein TerD